MALTKVPKSLSSTPSILDNQFGVDITGTVTADGLVVSAPSGDTPASIVTTTAGSFLQFTDGNTTAGRSPLVGVITDDLVFYTNAGSYSEKLRIDSTGRLLLGITSNLNGEALQIDANSVGSTVYTAYISNTNTSTSAYNVMRWAQGAAGSATGYAGTGGSATSNPAFRNSFVVGTQSNSPLVFATNDTERARIDATGNLLVGTSSAYTAGKLSVNGGIVQPSGNQNVIGVFGTSGLQMIGQTGAESIIGTMGANEPLVLRTGSTERMRISTAGHTTFGTTNLTPADSAVNGTSILSDGRINHNAQSQPAAVIGRTGTDGTIVDFRKSGTTVGSIGTSTGGLYIADAGVGFRFDSGGTDDIIPCNATGGAADASINLGSSGARFKDLYLSGSVVAGTGATAAATLNAYSKTVSTNLPSALRVIENTGASSYWDIGSTGGASNNLNFYANANTTPKMTLTGAGNVGIGVTPLELLHIESATTSPAMLVKAGGQVGSTTPTAELILSSGSLSSNDSACKVISYRIGDYSTAAVRTSGLKFQTTNANAPVTAMAIDNLGNVGIASATVGPTYKLDGGFADQTWGWYLNSSYNAGFTYNTTERSLLISTKSAENIDHIKFATGSAATERMRIDGVGNVGIGRTSISQPSAGATTLAIQGTTTDKGGAIRLYSSDDSVAAYIYLDNSNGLSINTQTSHPMVFRTANIERMRLDASGNLLVGTTSNSVYNDVSGTGIALNAGQIQIAGTGTPLYANRQGSNGDIIDLRRDGGVVGSIGTYNGVPYIGYAGGAGGGIMFNGRSIEPTALGSSRTNGANDIGSITYKWKDLHLAGGVYLGGTTAANKLDDYEEGTWTPMVSGGAGTVTASTAIGYYTKVGNLVTINGTYSWSANGNLGNNTTKITGFPFANRTAVNGRATGSFGAINGIAGADTLRLVCDPGNAWAYILVQNGTGYSHNNIFSASGNLYGFTLTYMTSS